MKRIEFIAPVESMRGNLSGNQSLEYAENNNPAYEAPNGVQYARNYQPRFIGAKRGADGLKYFAVRTKTATNLKASTRRAMAIVGVTAAIRSALMSAHAADYATMQRAFDYLKAQGLLPEGQNTFKKWFDANVKNMLVYKRATWSFTQSSISFTLNNPYNLASAQALVIKQSIWVKFANIFAFSGTQGGGVYFTIDGTAIFAPYDEGGTRPTFNTISKVNPHMTTLYAPMTVSGQHLTWNGQEVYTSAGIEVVSDAVVIADEKYTTAEPIEP